MTDAVEFKFEMQMRLATAADLRKHAHTHARDIRKHAHTHARDIRKHAHTHARSLARTHTRTHTRTGAGDRVERRLQDLVLNHGGLRENERGM